jgi:hypothetical protein
MLSVQKVNGDPGIALYTLAKSENLNKFPFWQNLNNLFVCMMRDFEKRIDNNYSAHHWEGAYPLPYTLFTLARVYVCFILIK